MTTYKHGDQWLTEVVIDDKASFSRPATEAEIAEVKNEPEQKRGPGRPRKNPPE